MKLYRIQTACKLKDYVIIFLIHEPLIIHHILSKILMWGLNPLNKVLLKTTVNLFKLTDEINFFVIFLLCFIIIMYAHKYAVIYMYIFIYICKYISLCCVCIYMRIYIILCVHEFVISYFESHWKPKIGFKSNRLSYLNIFLLVVGFLNFTFMC